MIACMQLGSGLRHFAEQNGGLQCIDRLVTAAMGSQIVNLGDPMETTTCLTSRLHSQVSWRLATSGHTMQMSARVCVAASI